MNAALTKLVRVAQKMPMTDDEREEQRIRFSYGSAKIENERVTEEMVRDAAAALRRDAELQNG